MFKAHKSGSEETEIVFGVNSKLTELSLLIVVVNPSKET